MTATKAHLSTNRGIDGCTCTVPFEYIISTFRFFVPANLPSKQHSASLYPHIYMIHSCTHRHSAEPRSIIKQPPDLCIPPALLTLAFTISLPLYDDLSRFLSPRMVAVHPFSVSPLSLSAVSRLIWHLPRCSLALFHRHIVVPLVFDRFTEHNKLRGDLSMRWPSS